MEPICECGGARSVWLGFRKISERVSFTGFVAVSDYGVRLLPAFFVLVLGVAYKKDIDDLRESPALEILHLLQEKGAQVFYHDPFCPLIADDGHTPLKNLPMKSVEMSEAMLQAMDAVVVIADHSSVDYALVAEKARLVIDTRGIMRGVPGLGRIVGLSGQEQAALVQRSSLAAAD